MALSFSELLSTYGASQDGLCGVGQGLRPWSTPHKPSPAQSREASTKEGRSVEGQTPLF